MRVSLGHGSPFVYGLFNGGNPVIRFQNAPQVWSGSEKDPVLGITASGHHYGLFGATGSTWTGIGSNRLTNNSNGKPYFSIALLPDNKPETLALFGKYAYNHIIDTHLDHRIEKGHALATYRPTFKAHEGKASAGTLFALYPHQWKYAASPLTDITYGSVRGTMKVATGESFSTLVPIQGVLPFTPASIYMGRSPAYVKKNHARIMEKRKGGTDLNKGWGDLVTMFQALADPAAAAKYIDTTPDCNVEGGNSRAFMYHWIHTLNNLGTNTAALTADYPIHNVFQKNGINTYTIYNYQTKPLTVTFSDGTKVLAKPGEVTVHTN